VHVLIAVGALLVGLVLGLIVARLYRRAPEPTVPTVATPAPPTANDRRRDLPAQVLEALGEGVVVVDRDEEVLLANPVARGLGAVIGDRLAHEGLRRVAYQALDSGDVRKATVELPRGYLGRETSSVSVTAVPIGSISSAGPAGSARAGRVLAVALLLSDLTEARRLEAVRRDFVANVSHELKTPVGALTLLAEAVQDASDDPEAVQRFAARMQHEGQRLGRLVGELIALSRVQGADALPDRQPISVAHLLGEAIDRSRLAAERAGIALVSSASPGLTVFGDETQLATAVSNLVDNAVSYSPGGTRVVVTGRAIVGSPTQRSCVEIVVADQGIGISDTDLDRIFERFYRVDPARSRATGGTGLGLAIVKHVVTNHGGTVEAWSSEGAGSTFTIRMPDMAPTTITGGRVSDPSATAPSFGLSRSAGSLGPARPPAPTPAPSTEVRLLEEEVS
jgi:two-component system, OmpR family, sensor histidine kinase SenX3